MIPLFLNRDCAVAWLQDKAMAQARERYGPGVRTSIGSCQIIEWLCNYTGFPLIAMRWGRRVLPGTGVKD